MKLLLDENLPQDLRHLLAGHAVFTVAYMGWSGLQNGTLLATAGDEGFEALVTLDSGIEYQQNLIALPCSVLIVRSPSNRLSDLRPLVPAILEALTSIKPQTLLTVG